MSNGVNSWKLDREAAKASLDAVHPVPFQEIKVGDYLYAVEIHMFGADKRRPMRVTRVDDETFDAILLNGDFGQPGQNMKAFHKRHQDWTRFP